ncbi:acyltransferase [Kineosporia sp. J2-2]|uniref:Acyltransferase n=1 Tax=Kineosporia corallincola TaxID=2835133 RepID=A0ABS5TEM6_9ACTN|nr:acyltransferase family protein [Kineosporia corallincola]MBT0769516.1 acyltransferase [Kineosporia corallincola]
MKHAPIDAPPPAGGARTTQASSHRSDIQGLRAVAVLMVLLYHTGLGPSGGFIGVDVFFVLSGFLITGLLIREHDRTGRIALLTFWARRARRLLPAGVLVLLVTCLVARWWLPAARWESIGQDAIAASAYFINWRLAAGSVDYLSEGAAASPLQHYWSLAIEEQFYLAWPLLITLLLIPRSRRPAAAVIGLVIAGSFTLALLTYGPQTYFTTHTRVWELAAGALCAVVMSRRSGQPRWGGAMSWLGLALTVGALFVVRPETMWPGPLTAVVVAGTVLVLRFGEAPRGTGRLLSVRPLTWLGDISYSLYLWHWPLVVFAERDGVLTLAEGAGVAVVSVLLAAVTYVLVERPARTARFWLPTRLGIAGGLTLVLVAAGSGSALSQSRSITEAKDPAGAAAVQTVQTSATTLSPPPEEAEDDSGDIYRRDCPSNYEDTSVRPCVFDYSTGAADPVVAVVGDSKAGQWVPALEEIAKQHHWKLISITKAGCPFSDITRLEGKPLTEYTACVTWNQAAVQELRTLAPDVLFTTQLGTYITTKNGEQLDGEANREEEIRGLSARIDEVTAAGIPVVTFAETPHLPQFAPDCVSLHLNDLTACAVDRAEAFANSGIVKEASERSDVPMLDLTDSICAPTQCAVVIGDVLAYRDDHHLTATFARTLAPFVEQRLGAALESEPTVRSELLD